MDIDDNFLQRISQLENDLLSLDRDSIDHFHDRWSQYTTHLTAAIDSDSLNISTISAARTLANKVSKGLQTFLDLELLAEKLMASLLEETSTALEFTNAGSHLSKTSYVQLSHEWLVENVHNPYPSTRVRDAIAMRSGSARKDVDNWFIDARKRIGWNEARKAHFSNKRIDIVDAATRFYANNENLTLSQDAELALVSIKKNAKDLYNNKFTETMLASKIAAVGEVTPHSRAETSEERARQSQLKDRYGYPSPEVSPNTSRLTPVLGNDEVQNATSQPTSSTKRKRRSVSVETIEPNERERTRPAKRTRLDLLPTNGIPPPGLPSPTSSIDGLPTYSSTSQPSVPSTSSSPTHTISSRKRRLSESEDHGTPKRPLDLHTDTRLRTISEPLQLSHLFDESSFDGWFQQAFDLPEVGEISPSSFSVELGSLSDLDCDTPAVTRSATPEDSGLVKQSFQPPTLEADLSSTMNTQWNSRWSGGVDLNDHCQADSLFALSDPTSLLGFSLDSTGREILSTPWVQDVSNFLTLPQGSHSSSDLNSFYDISNIDATVTPVSSALNAAWDLTPREAAWAFRKNDEESGISTDLFPSVDFHLGTDLLPLSDTTYLQTYTADKAKQEKEKEYREAMEKARRLALELQQEGVVVP